MSTPKVCILMTVASLIFTTSLIAQLSFTRIPMQWEAVSPYQIIAVTVSPKTSSVFIVASGVGVMRSSNRGASWDVVLSIATDSWAYRPLAADNSGIVYLGTSTGDLYRGSNDGTQWQKLTTLPYPIQSICPSKTGTIFVAAGWLYYSVDGGATWSYRNNTYFQNCYLVAETHGGELIAASAYNRDISRSLDGGKTWTLDPGSVTGVTIYAPPVLASNQRGALLIWYNGYKESGDGDFGGIFRSTDTSRTWALKMSGDGPGSILADRDGNFILSLLPYGSGGLTLSSLDDGLSFSQIDGPAGFLAATDTNQFYYCGGEGDSLYRGRLMPRPGPLEDFGSVGINTSTNLQLTISNSTSTPNTLTTVLTNSTAFGEITPHLPISIPANGRSRIEVAFAPKNYGSFEDTLRIFDLTGDEIRVPVHGICPYPSMILSTSLLDFGPLVRGASGLMKVTITSNSLNPLRVDSLRFSSKDFTFAPIDFPLSLQYGDSVMVSVSCTSTSAQNVHDTLRIFGNAIQGVGTVAATVNYADLVVAPKEIDFIQAKVDSLSAGSLFLTNPYSTPLKIDTMYTHTPVFSAGQSGLPNILAGRSTLRLPLAFHPTSQRFFSDTLIIATEGANALIAVPVRGYGSVFNRIVSLSLGNTWAYRFHYQYYGQTQSTSDYTRQKRLIGDTTINEQVWKIIQVAGAPDTIPHSFELWRCDTTLLVSSTGPGFQGTLFDRRVTADSSWSLYHDDETSYFVQLGSDSEWGGVRSSQQWGYSYTYSAGPRGSLSTTVLDGIGPTSINEYMDGRTANFTTSTNGTLIAALIDGVVYGDTTLVSVHETKAGFTSAVNTFLLMQNYPNPFNPVTTIAFRIPDMGVRQRTNVKLVVYDLLGREVRVLINEAKAPGIYSVRFDGSALASGVYFYRLQADSYIQTKKFVLLK